ncbi:MAG: 1-deoxy-D-xylulose-5-phosphate reductoisomerase [candidate division Zixibacteria bacterium]
MKNISILGSTGSIGRSTLDVITDNPGSFNIVALAAGRNLDLLKKQIRKFNPKFVSVYSEKEADILKNELPGKDIEIIYGPDGLQKLASLAENDIVLNALVGAAGLLASLETIKAGKNLALANKESLVVGGPLFEDEVIKSGGKIMPVDSEHSAIWQCMNAGKLSEIRKIILTASGGPFRTRDKESFKAITIDEALAHPTWKMGPKITIDSATMMNKGLELIEAVWLFTMPTDQIEIVIHPQSIVHSLVEYDDSSIIAQLSNPDMKLPIAYALFWPDRVESDNGRLSLTEAGRLEFYEPDEEKFPALRLARNVAEAGGTAPAVLNAANEKAVAYFLDGRIGFVQITELIERILVEHNVVNKPNLDDILNIDRETRNRAEEIVRKMTC